MLSLEKNGAATATVSRNVSVIKSFFAYLLRNKSIENEPSINLKAPKIVKRVPDILTIDEMDRLLAMPDTDSPKGLRDKAMLELLYATGLKVSELVNLRVDDINLETRTLRCCDGDKERHVPFGHTAQNAVRCYITAGRAKLAEDKNEYLFVNCDGNQMSRQGFWKIIKKYGELAGFGERLTPHIFRHSFAAHMIENGADLKSIQEMLGHSDISTTQIYSSFADNGISAVYEMAHPRK